MSSITGVLCKVAVVEHVCCRYRINIIVRVYGCSVGGSALPVPQIFACGEAAKAHEVAAATAFEIELTAPLVEDVHVRCDRAYLLCVGTLAQLVDVRNSLLGLAFAIISLCTCKINLCITEQRNVYVRIFGVVCGLTVCTEGST